MTSPTTLQLVTMNNVQALVNEAFASANAAFYDVKPITYYGGVAGTNITTQGQTALDNSNGFELPAGTWYADQFLIKGHNKIIRLAPGAILVKVSASNPGWGNAFITNGGAFTASKVQNFRLDGLGSITTDPAAHGGMIQIYGDDQNYHDFTITEWEDGLAFFVGGDRLRATKIKTLNVRPAFNPNTGLTDLLGSGGFRYAAGKDSIVYGTHIVAGDDCYQAVPAQQTFAHPFANQDIDGLHYIGVTGRSLAARFFAAVLSDVTAGSTGMTADVRNVFISNFYGYGGSRSATIRNEFGTAGSTGELHNIVMSNGTFDCLLANESHNEEVLIARQAGTGRVRGVVFDNVSVINPKGRTLSTNGAVERPRIYGGFWPANPAGNVVMDLSESTFPEVKGAEFSGGGSSNVILCGGAALTTKRPIIEDCEFNDIPASAYTAVNFNTAPGAIARRNTFRGGVAATAVKAVRFGAGSTAGVCEENDVTEMISTNHFTVLADTRKRYNRGDLIADQPAALDASTVATKIDAIDVQPNTTGGAYTLENGFPRHKITLTAAATALTAPAAVAGDRIVVYLIQGSTGNRTATWTGTVPVVGLGAVMNLSTAVGKIDRVVLDCITDNQWIAEPVAQAISG